MFYSGLVRKKNVLGVMMQCVFLMGLLSVVWALWGYSLAFGGANSDKPLGAYVGNADYLFLNGVFPTDSLPDPPAYPTAPTIPPALFMVYQMMFFIITPALICGAFAERMKFSTMCVFCVLWGTFVYCPVAHWVWAPSGWLFKKGALDFAGGTVVHLISGLSALICALVIGKRLGFGQEPMPPHNLTYTTIGAALLWVGRVKPPSHRGPADGGVADVGLGSLGHARPLYARRVCGGNRKRRHAHAPFSRRQAERVRCVRRCGRAAMDELGCAPQCAPLGRV